MDIDIVTREEWGARPPKRRHAISIPTKELWLHHSAGNELGAAGVRQIQNFHMDGRGWSDIAYSFLVDQVSLRVFEGRGAGVAGGHTKGHNTISHAICVMGNFDNTKPTQKLIDRIAELVQYGHDRGWWPDRLTGGHRDVSATACPGELLYNKIHTINAIIRGGTGDDMTDEVVELQTILVEAGIDIGDFGPKKDGIDGKLGQFTLNGVRELKRRSETELWEAARYNRIAAIVNE